MCFRVAEKPVFSLFYGLSPNLAPKRVGSSAHYGCSNGDKKGCLCRLVLIAYFFLNRNAGVFFLIKLVVWVFIYVFWRYNLCSKCISTDNLSRDVRVRCYGIHRTVSFSLAMTGTSCAERILLGI